MKKFFFILLSLIILSSCSKDDNEDISPESIVGFWNSVKSVKYTLDLKTGEKYNYVERDYTDYYMKLYIDGTFEEKNLTLKRGTYYLSKDTIFVDIYNPTNPTHLKGGWIIDKMEHNSMVVSNYEIIYDPRYPPKTVECGGYKLMKVEEYK